MPREISKFVTSEKWSIHHSEGSRLISIDQTVDARKVAVEWLLPEIDTHGPVELDFRISVEDKLTPQGMVFSCVIRETGNYRYIIKFIRCYRTYFERDSSSSYGGPRFDSLEPELQAALDEVLHSWGVNEEVIDFIGASSKYYYNSEYINWLHNVNDFISK